MPIMANNLDHYLYTTQRDVFVLKLTHPDEDPEEPESIMKKHGNYRDPGIQVNQKIATDWFDAHGVEWARTSPSVVLTGYALVEGWYGEIYVGFNGWEDARLHAWCDEFEIDGVDPKYPEKFILWVIRYESWAKKGGIEKHEKHLAMLADPDYCP
jgi:hypothetical protein